jgi:hypothetical protein
MTAPPLTPSDPHNDVINTPRHYKPTDEVRDTQQLWGTLRQYLPFLKSGNGGNRLPQFTELILSTVRIPLVSR